MWELDAATGSPRRRVMIDTTGKNHLIDPLQVAEGYLQIFSSRVDTSTFARSNTSQYSSGNSEVITNFVMPSNDARYFRSLSSAMTEWGK